MLLLKAWLFWLSLESCQVLVCKKKSIEWLNHTYGFYIDEPIRTGVLFYKAVSSFKPDYYVDYLDNSPWIHMPYEKYETMKPEELD